MREFAVKKKILVIIILAIFFVGMIFCWQGINPSQPLSVGDEIYFVRCAPVQGKIPVTYFGETYTYLGMNGNCLLVGYESDRVSSSRTEPGDGDIDLLSLPLNDKRQALLEIAQYPKERTDRGKGKQSHGARKKYLLITVVDDLGHIRVEEYKGAEP